MDSVSLDQIKDFVIVLFAILAAVVLIGNVVKTISGWRKPHNDLQEWKNQVDAKMESDNERLEILEGGNRVICRGILAMLSHEINGNSNDKLIASQQEITNYLIDR